MFVVIQYSNLKSIKARSSTRVSNHQILFPSNKSYDLYFNLVLPCTFCVLYLGFYLYDCFVAVSRYHFVGKKIFEVKRGNEIGIIRWYSIYTGRNKIL